MDLCINMGKSWGQGVFQNLTNNPYLVSCEDVAFCAFLILSEFFINTAQNKGKTSKARVASLRL